MSKVQIEKEGKFWGVPYGECVERDDDGEFIQTLFHFEVAMGDLFFKDVHHEVLGKDTVIGMVKAMNTVIERHDSGELIDG